MEFQYNKILQVFKEAKCLTLELKTEKKLWDNVYFHLENDARNSSSMLLSNVLLQATQLLLNRDEPIHLCLTNWITSEFGTYEWAQNQIELHPLTEHFYFPIAYGHEMIHALDHHVSHFEGLKRIIKQLSQEEHPHQILACMLHVLQIRGYDESCFVIEFDQEESTPAGTQVTPDMLVTLASWLESHDCVEGGDLYVPPIYLELVAYAFELIFNSLNQCSTLAAYKQDLEKRKETHTQSVPESLQSMIPSAWKYIALLVQPLCEVLAVSFQDDLIAKIM